MKTALFLAFLVLVGCDSFPIPLKPVSPSPGEQKFKPCNYPSNSARCVRQRSIESAKTTEIIKDGISLRVKALQRFSWFFPAQVFFHIQVRNESSIPIRLPQSLISLQINEAADHIKPTHFNLDDDLIVNPQSTEWFRVSFDIDPKHYEGKNLYLTSRLLKKQILRKTLSLKSPLWVRQNFGQRRKL
jgi:hypothetical protein